MSLLSIVQNAADEVGVGQPTAVIGSTDPTAIQMLALCNRHGQHLVERYDWEILTKEATFSTIAAESQGTVLAAASDFHHYINDTMFNRTTNRKILGPYTPAQWQREKANSVASNIDTYFRIRGGLIIFIPDPTASQTVAFEYATNKWADTTGGGANKTSMTIDTDVAEFDEELMTLGVIWRFLKAKGLDYSEPFRDHEISLQRALARDGGKPRVNLAGGVPIDPTVTNFPDGSWSIT